jgi:hypothetical protein
VGLLKLDPREGKTYVSSQEVFDKENLLLHLENFLLCNFSIDFDHKNFLLPIFINKISSYATKKINDVVKQSNQAIKSARSMQECVNE